jgi:hypothetical protein
MQLRITLLAAVCAIAVAGAPVAASGIAGVYCIVQKVVMAPSETAPTTVQVWGACALAKGGMAYSTPDAYEPGWYTEPFRGYLYYTAPKGREAVCAREWADLKSVAGTGAIVAFGAVGLDNGRMRWPDYKPENPDPYPVHMGVTKVTRSQHPVGKPPYSYKELFDGLVKAAGGK